VGNLFGGKRLLSSFFFTFYPEPQPNTKQQLRHTMYLMRSSVKDENVENGATVGHQLAQGNNKVLHTSP